MSTKETLIRTDDEHWYKDNQARIWEQAKTDTVLVLEFGLEHKIEKDEQGTRVIIEEGTGLYKEIMAALSGNTAIKVRGCGDECVTAGKIRELMKEI